jgi:hypothetical protein
MSKPSAKQARSIATPRTPDAVANTAEVTLTPGNQTSEYKLALNNITWGNIISAFGAILAIASVVLVGIQAELEAGTHVWIGPVVMGIGAALKMFPAANYNNGRARVKAAALSDRE